LFENYEGIGVKLLEDCKGIVVNIFGNYEECKKSKNNHFFSLEYLLLTWQCLGGNVRT
jgi:hypothetical protein